MFTNNFITLMRHKSFGSSYENYVNVAGSSIKGYQPSLMYACILKYMATGLARTIVTAGNESNNAPEVSCYPGVYFGTGVSAPTKQDYVLESPIASGLSITNSSIKESSNDNGKHEFTASYILSNTTDKDLNIYEIGLFLPVTTSSNASKYVWNNVLMERTVLTAPVTVPANGLAKINYTVTFNQTFNVE